MDNLQSVWAIVPERDYDETGDNRVLVVFPTEELATQHLADRGGDGEVVEVPFCPSLPTPVETRYHLNCSVSGGRVGYQNKDVTKVWAYDEDALAHPMKPLHGAGISVNGPNLSVFANGTDESLVFAAYNEQVERAKKAVYKGFTNLD